LVVLVGHLHDGGENIVLSLKGKEICNSKAHYGAKPEYVADGVVNPNKQQQWATISDMDICQIMKPVKKGDSLSIVANCKCPQFIFRLTDSLVLDDMTKHPARKDMHGKDEGLMGVVMSQMAVPMTPK
jgi:hypothetical protein